jgi:hypothetical protein
MKFYSTNKLLNKEIELRKVNKRYVMKGLVTGEKIRIKQTGKGQFPKFIIFAYKEKR